MFQQILKNKTHLAYLLLSLACLFWAGNFVMGKGISDTVPPMALSFWRWLLAALILLPFAWPHLKKDAPLLKKNWKYYTLMGFIGGASYNALTYLALHTTTATNALVLNSANALFIVLANYLIHKLRPTPGQFIAIIIAMSGMLFIITQGDLQTLKTFTFKSGDLLVLISMIGWAMYTALLINRPPTHLLSFSFVTFMASAVTLTPFIIIEHNYFSQLIINVPTLAAILYAAIFPGVLAYIFYNRGVELIGGNRAGIVIYLVPFFGAILSFIFLKEIPQIYHLIGFVLIISGVVLSAKKKGPNKIA